MAAEQFGAARSSSGCPRGLMNRGRCSPLLCQDFSFLSFISSYGGGYEDKLLYFTSPASQQPNGAVQWARLGLQRLHGDRAPSRSVNLPSFPAKSLGWACNSCLRITAAVSILFFFNAANWCSQSQLQLSEGCCLGIIANGYGNVFKRLQICCTFLFMGLFLQKG